MSEIVALLFSVMIPQLHNVGQMNNEGAAAKVDNQIVADALLLR